MPDGYFTMYCYRLQIRSPDMSKDIIKRHNWDGFERPLSKDRSKFL